MAIIRGDQKISWDVMGRDKFLRNKEAPALFEDPITTRDVRGGAEVVTRSGNVMPRAISRDKLGLDALLQPLNLNATASEVVQVATGYDRALNDYLYVVLWDGVNYSLRRFNTNDLMSPFQDAYSVNLPVDAKRNQVLGVTVMDTQVAVLIRNNEGVSVYYYSFDLAYQSTVSAPPLGFATREFTRNLVYDGQYLVHTVPSSAYLMIRQSLYDTVVGAGDNSSGAAAARQRFTTTSNGGNIKRVSVVLQGSGLGGTDKYYDLILLNASNSIIQTASVGTQFSSAAPAAWYNVDVNWAVLASTVYKIAPRGEAPSSFFTPKIAYINAERYSGGYFVQTGAPDSDANTDMAFAVYQALPSGWGGKIMRFSPTDYSLVDSYSWPAGTTQPDEILAYDQRFYYGYISSENKIVKFAIQDGAISVAAEQTIHETVRGILHFNSFVFFVYQIGSSIVAVPVSI